MKAIQLVGIGEPLEFRDVEKPRPEPGEVLVRMTAAGICHSDAHYRDGTSPVGRTPITPGHEVAGVIEEVGSASDESLLGRRVCLHYLVTCEDCGYCRAGQGQFCPQGQMIGKHRDGGYAEYLTVPVRNAVAIPDNVQDEQAAIMMCSSATSYHALRKGRLVEGETVAVIGCGGLGMSAIMLARIMGAARIFAVDLDEKKLEVAATLGAESVDGADRPWAEIQERTSGRGVDVAVEVIGNKQTMELAISLLGPRGRAAIAGICDHRIDVRPYPDLINREAEIIGVSDHLLSELDTILRWASEGKFDLSPFVSKVVSLDADEINGVLDELVGGTSSIRSVIMPGR